jgi:hypothetical protein
MLIVNKFSEAKVHPAEEIICKIGNRPGMEHGAWSQRKK